MIIVLGCKVLLLVLTIPFLLLSILYRPSYRIPSSCNSLRLRHRRVSGGSIRGQQRGCAKRRTILWKRKVFNKYGVTSCI